MDNFKFLNMSGQPKDTMPRSGRVNEMCQEWMVREDSAIAHHLQNEEIQQHYTGNKQRNQLVREDFPRAKSEQMKEQEMAEQAAAIYHKMLAEQEEIDKQLAEQLAKKLEFEESAKKRNDELIGLKIAQKLQEREIQKAPSRPPKKSQTSSRAMSQEEADAELARMLQEQEGNLEETLLHRDRLLAIEAQDKELAKVLQERERIKARKAKERARQKALAKKQQAEMMRLQPDQIMPDDAYSNPADMIRQEAEVYEPEDPYTLPVDEASNEPSTSRHSTPSKSTGSPGSMHGTPTRPSYLNLKPSYKPRYPDPEEVPARPNIAMAIDPTYPSSPSGSLSAPLEDGGDSNAPPYMPIQGQKRTASLEKKKRRTRDGCKQQ